MTDQETLAAYATRVDDYIAMVRPAPSEPLVAFANTLPEGARVLDLGCGPGHAAKYLATRGFDTHAWDMSPEMVEAATAQGVTTRIAGFDDLTEIAVFDGIYANFSLLHARKADMPRHMAAIAAALRPDGVFHIGMKLGEGEERDQIGRFYAYYTRAELMDLLAANGLAPVWEREGEEKGLAGNTDRFILIRALKS
ncbi:MAG: class I SAM-dependent methyltransferase [Pseudomonadota bacterium]